MCGHTMIFLRNMSVNLKYNERKENKNMKIAVTYEDGMVFQHFGHTQ